MGAPVNEILRIMIYMYLLGVAMGYLIGAKI